MGWSEFIDYKIGTIGSTDIFVRGVISAIIVVAATWFGIKLWRRAILKPRRIIGKIDEKKRISIFLITKYVGWVVSILLGLKMLGFDITPLIFGSTAVLLGLGFGLQSIFRDFISGLFLLFEGSLKIGDVIEVDGIVGRVLEIHLRSTELLTRDDVIIVIPNSKFVEEKVVNWSMENELVRFKVGVNVAYGSDVEEVISCLEEAMEENDDIVSKPLPFVRFTEFGESALEFEMIFWSNKGFMIDNVKSDLRRKVYRKLKEKGLAIPFPQRDVHLKGVEELLKMNQKEKV